MFVWLAAGAAVGFLSAFGGFVLGWAGHVRVARRIPVESLGEIPCDMTLDQEELYWRTHEMTTELRTALLDLARLEVIARHRMGDR